MSKVDIDYGIEDLPSNKEIFKEYLKNFNHSEQFKRIVKSNVSEFLRVYDKSLFNIQLRDFKKYFNYLNNNPDQVLLTKKGKYGKVKKFIISFLDDHYKELRLESMELLMFYRFLDKRPEWKKEYYHKQVENDHKSVMMEKEDLIKIIDYFKSRYNKYLMFRVLAETGCRKGELLSIDLVSKKRINGKYIPIEEDLKNRKLRMKGKTGFVNYPISEDLSKKLLRYLEERLDPYYNPKAIANKMKALFVSMRGTRFSRALPNADLKKALIKMHMFNRDIDGKAMNNITIHCFRRSLNTQRKRLGCTNEEAKLLLNHKVDNKDKILKNTGDVNIDHYSLDDPEWNKVLALFDKYNPYKDLK